MIEVNSQQAQQELPSLLEEVHHHGRKVRIFHGEKVVAEIVPASGVNPESAVYRPHAEPHLGIQNDEELCGYSYQTMGETLRRL